MRLVTVLTLALLSCSSPTSAWLFSGDNIVSSIIDKGVSAVHNVVNEGIQLGGKVIGAIFDPLEIWKPETDIDHGHKEGKVTKCPAIADVIFVMDSSGSIGAEDFYKQIDFAKRLTEHFRIGRNDVRFGAVVFSDVAQKLFDLEDFSNHKDIAEALEDAPYFAEGTKTYHGLDMVRTGGMFKSAAGSRSGSSKIVIVMTDGQSDRIFKTTESANALKAEGVTIIAVGIGAAGLGIELHSMASGDYNVFHADDYDSLNNIEQTVAKRTCDIPQQAGNVPVEEVVTDYCRGSPCQQTCTSFSTGYVCSCQSGFVVSSTDSTKCQEVKKCHVMADIIFLLDSSGSIGSPNYEKQLNFVKKVAKRFEIGANKVRFGAVVFSNDAEKLFDLDTYSDWQSLANGLSSAPYLKGMTYTNKALTMVIDDRLFSRKKGGRIEAEKIVVILTDGKSSRPDLTLIAAAALKDKGVKILSVGIGQNISDEELADMASNANYVLKADSYELLDNLEDLVAKRTCGE